MDSQAKRKTKDLISWLLKKQVDLDLHCFCFLSSTYSGSEHELNRIGEVNLLLLI